MWDLLIANGLIVDGTGSPPFEGSVAIEAGVIVALGDLDLDNLSGVEVIDAEGMAVIPGIVDIHTHYDGQATWDDLLEPSSGHGVTTIVMGNCGVGFAPVRPGQEEWLIQLMEGVEDIPGAALSEGMTWGWETFPEYLDVLATRKYALDVGAMVNHGALRAYVMGEAGARNEAANARQIDEMHRLVVDAMHAGALGFSTSRTMAHRAIDGEPVPGTFAAEDELFGIGRALKVAGRGVFELAPAGAAGEDVVAPAREIEWMVRLSEEIECPVTWTLVQVDAAPMLWKDLLAECERANDIGAQVYPQVTGRPVGILVGLETGHHPFATRPSWSVLEDLRVDQMVERLQDPTLKAQLLSEEPDGSRTLVRRLADAPDRIYVLGNPPVYEPGPESSVAAIAKAEGREPLDVLYDLLLEQNGHALLMWPLVNYSDGDSEATFEMLKSESSVVGLSDGGAHCGTICDASLPTWMLSHWVRDRTRGDRLPLEFIVRKQTHDTARLFGLRDRGTIEVGMKADLNVVDLERVQLLPPEMVADLPAGGRRLIQRADGYVCTVVSGVVTRRNGADTGARPGRLVRSC